MCARERAMMKTKLAVFDHWTRFINVNGMALEAAPAAEGESGGYGTHRPYQGEEPLWSCRRRRPSVRRVLINIRNVSRGPIFHIGPLTGEKDFEGLSLSLSLSLSFCQVFACCCFKGGGAHSSSLFSGGHLTSNKF